jgi:hypothetical protein
MRLGQRRLGGDSLAGDDAVKIVKDVSKGARPVVLEVHLACRTRATTWDVACESRQKLMPIYPHTQKLMYHLPRKRRIALVNNDNCPKSSQRAPPKCL